MKIVVICVLGTRCLKHVKYGVILNMEYIMYGRQTMPVYMRKCISMGDISHYMYLWKYIYIIIL